MSDNIFTDAKKKPTESRLLRALGKRGGYWKALRDHVQEAHGPLKPVWKYYGAKYGWGMKMFKGSRNLFFLSARQGSFVIGFLFGEKAVDAVKMSDLPQETIQKLVNARRYAEGRGISIEVKSRRAVEIVKTLVEIKVAH